ncbi:MULTISPECIES: hypothetical protein [Saccharibacillus]|uniref:hypothetical protein n=1 Tax=Saccharibacillus TaxID=456492 RepID=UPI00123B5957|nr:hypothetical protein [Saccharibacillus sp. WB 17]MWJ30994.1 hypothetical protein [Saccharibacillus sp. WB 17]
MKKNKAKKLLKAAYGKLFGSREMQGGTVSAADSRPLRPSKRGGEETFDYDRSLNEELTLGLLRGRM